VARLAPARDSGLPLAEVQRRVDERVECLGGDDEGVTGLPQSPSAFSMAASRSALSSFISATSSARACRPSARDQWRRLFAVVLAESNPART
jgi:hypothetical protein